MECAARGPPPLAGRWWRCGSPWPVAERATRPDGQSLSPIDDGERAVQVRSNGHAEAGVAAAVGAGAQLQPPALQLDGIIVLDLALVLETTDLLQIWRRGAPRRCGVCGRVGKAGVEPPSKAVEDPLGLRERLRARESQLDDQAILQRAEEPFYSTFRLRRIGRDPLEAQFLHRAADLGGFQSSLELLRDRQGRAGIAMENAVTISVDGRRHAIARDQLAEEQQVAVRVLFLAKDAAEQFARRIIDRGEQDEARPAVLQPRVVTAVHLNEQAGLRHPLAAAAMARRAAGPRTPDASLAQQALDRGPRDGEGFPFPQELGELMVIDAGIGRAGQGHDLGPYGVGQAPLGHAPAITVGQGGGALRPYLRQQPPDVPHRQAHEARRRTGRKRALLHLRQNMCTLLLLLGQGDRLPGHPPRVTESLSR